MSSVPTFFFDGATRLIYEVPPGASYTMQGAFRIYTGGPSAPALMQADVKRDLWSRWLDYTPSEPWALLAFTRSGGAANSSGGFDSATFTLINGWRLVLANYPHETVFVGNLKSESGVSRFDVSRLTAQGVQATLQGAADLITYNTGGGSSGGTGPTAAEIAAAVWQLAGGIEESITPQQAMRALLAVGLGSANGLSAAGQIEFRNPSGSKARVKLTVTDELGSRANPVLDL